MASIYFGFSVQKFDIVEKYDKLFDIMSDGPHRSLPMRDAWKRLADRASKRAWSVEAVADGFCKAVATDFKREVSADLLLALNGILRANKQYNIFAEHGAEELGALRSLTATGSFAESIIDNIEIAYRGGRFGEVAWQEALQKSFLERGGEGSLQIDEHYKRRAKPAVAKRVRERLQDALRSAKFQSLSKSLIDAGGTTTSSPSPSPDKGRGLDAGPEL